MTGIEKLIAESTDTRLAKVCEALLSAVQFYACPSTYQVRGNEQMDGDTRPIKRDRGKTARDAMQSAETIAKGE